MDLQPQTMKEDAFEPMVIKVSCNSSLEEKLQSSTLEVVAVEVNILLDNQQFLEQACFHKFTTCPKIPMQHPGGNCRHQVICGTTTLV